MRLIDAERIPNDEFFKGLTDIEKAKVLQWFVSAPTVDAVKVTRCKDCDYCHEYTKWNGKDYLGCNRLAEFCDGQVVEVDAYDFCSYMNRRSDND